MANRRRTAEFEMNFDGLTDSVTNLVGSLILILVLLIGVTTKAVFAPPPSSIPDEGMNSNSRQEAQTVSTLFEQIALLRAGINSIQIQADGIEREIPVLKTQVENMSLNMKLPRPSEQKKPKTN